MFKKKNWRMYVITDEADSNVNQRIIGEIEGLLKGATDMKTLKIREENVFYVSDSDIGLKCRVYEFGLHCKTSKARKLYKYCRKQYGKLTFNLMRKEL